MKWEYLIFWDENYAADLNDFVKDGWELVNVEGALRDGFYFFFKRPVMEAA